MYGYEVRNGSFAIKPEEAAVVRRIFQMYLGGMGSVKIMKLLTEEGVGLLHKLALHSYTRI